MKKRFFETQIVGFLREADGGVPVKEPCRTHGFPEGSFYLWRSKFGGMSVSDAKRLKELELENGRMSSACSSHAEATRGSQGNEGLQPPDSGRSLKRCG